MDAADLFEALSADPSDASAWRSVGLALGAETRRAPAALVARWVDAVQRVRVEKNSWSAGAKEALLSVLSAMRQEDVQQSEDAVGDADLRAAPSLWGEIAGIAAARADGSVRLSDVIAATRVDKGTVSRTLRKMTEQGLLEAPADIPRPDMRSRPYRLLPRGRRLAELVRPSQARRDVPKRAAAEAPRSSAGLVHVGNIAIQMAALRVPALDPAPSRAVEHWGERFGLMDPIAESFVSCGRRAIMKDALKTAAGEGLQVTSGPNTSGSKEIKIAGDRLIRRTPHVERR
jgi:DNA-binding MarR family transcriptional regulator